MELALNTNHRYSYADYLTWLDDKRRELIDGFVHLMSPAPAMRHETTRLNIAVNIKNYIKKHYRKKAGIYTAPFDVRLPIKDEKTDEQIYTVVQPDICVVCDLSKIDKRGCLGAPDMIVEILSPSTTRYDLNEKYSIYEKSGVREYWAVEPNGGAVTVFLLQENGKYDNGTVYEDEMDKIPVYIFDGLIIDWQDIFDD
ncbi:MAG: Uma2 family endonuclease [Paludibacter sp.]|jgi:Uma2 family endonuclease|nr:Uma2 family endonuclease [Paludibacter sp.]